MEIKNNNKKETRVLDYDNDLNHMNNTKNRILVETKIIPKRKQW
jgi:hypothetical protein